MEENLPSDLMSRLNCLQAELDLANAANQTNRSAIEEADAIVAEENKEREEKIASLKNQIRDLKERLESSVAERDCSYAAYDILHDHHEKLAASVKKLEDDKKTMSTDINQLKTELDDETRLKGIAEQTAYAAVLQLSTVEQLLEQEPRTPQLWVRNFAA